MCVYKKMHMLLEIKTIKNVTNALLSNFCR